jgi:hypothetical protein
MNKEKQNGEGRGEIDFLQIMLTAEATAGGVTAGTVMAKAAPSPQYRVITLDDLLKIGEIMGKEIDFIMLAKIQKALNIKFQVKAVKKPTSP